MADASTGAESCRRPPGEDGTQGPVSLFLSFTNIHVYSYLCIYIITMYLYVSACIKG